MLHISEILAGFNIICDSLNFENMNFFVFIDIWKNIVVTIHAVIRYNRIDFKSFYSLITKYLIKAEGFCLEY
jgi:hypothetical protein